MPTRVKNSSLVNIHQSKKMFPNLLKETLKSGSLYKVVKECTMDKSKNERIKFTMVYGYPKDA